MYILTIRRFSTAPPRLRVALGLPVILSKLSDNQPYCDRPLAPERAQTHLVLLLSR